MNILVTGASGFVGQPLVNKLIQQGHNVLALTRSIELLNSNDYSSNLLYLQTSLNLENNAMDHIREFKPEVLIHLAWEKIPDFTFETSFENLQNHISFFRHIFKIGSLKKIVVTGSCWEYNKKIGICAESDVSESSNYFTWAKNTLRDFLQLECLQKNINFVWSRIFYVYGPQQRKESLLPTIIENIQNGLSPQLKTPSNSNDFIYVDDVADGLIHFAVKDIPSGVYNLGSGKSVPIIEILSIIEKSILGINKFSKEALLNTNSVIKDTNFWADMSKTITALEWQPTTSLVMGIEKTIK